MKAPGVPINENERLHALEQYNILDTLPEASFDALTALAAHILKVPIALVSLIDSDRQWFKSRHGLGATQTPRDVSFCGHVVADEQLLVVPDAFKDARFCDNPLVTGEPRVRFYVGFPLKSDDGFVLGTLCGIDHQAHEVTAEQLDMLRLLASQVMDQLELRRKNKLLAAKSSKIQVYQIFFSVSLSLLCTANKEGYFIELNPAWETVLGWTMDELRARTFIEFVHPEDVEKTKNEAARLFNQSGSTVNFENRYLHKDGRWIWLSWAVSVTNDIIYAVARDISERKRAETDLARLAAIVEFSDDAIISKTLDGIITSWNRAAEKLFGYTTEESLGRPMKMLFPADRYDEESKILDQITKGISIDHFETIRVKKDGTPIHVSATISPLKNSSGQVIGASKIVHDITARKKISAALKSSENRLRAVVETAVDPIITIDYLGTIETANQAVVNLFGFTFEELLGQNVRMLMPSPDREQHDGYLFNYMHTGIRKVIGIGREVIARKKDGTMIPVELSISEMLIDGRRMFTGILRDISERKKIERLQSEFVSTVSHELRTPLTSIRGSLGLVSGGMTGELSEDTKELVDIALNNCDRLVRLINDILDMEKIQSGRIEFRLKIVDLLNSVQHAMAANEAFAATHKTHLELVGQPAAGDVIADEDRLIQVLTNLISNAAKFSPPDSNVEVSVIKLDERLRVNIRDHGVGIPDEFKKRIFQRFSQADSSDTRQKGGTGLGLSISKAIVEQLHGTIGFEDAAGGGTCFFFELPCVVPVDKQQTTDPRAALVLVCESNPVTAQDLSKLMEQSNLIAHVASTVARARQLLSKFRYRVVTLDITLADGDGSVLIGEMRNSPRHKDTPIIVLTGLQSGVQSYLGSAAVDVADILIKPIDELRLLNAIRVATAQVSSSQLRVLHVEDDADLRLIVKRHLPSTWDVFEADGLRSAEILLAQASFDVILLDLGLPDGSGETLLGSVGNAKVIIFSANEAAFALSPLVGCVLTKSQTSIEDLCEAIVSLAFKDETEAS